MNLSDSYFLCLDIGTNGVRGIAHHINTGNIDKSAIHSVDDGDTVYALKSVIDELEHKMGTHFDCAYITGNLGRSHFELANKSTTWSGEHKISATDIRDQIAQITPPDGFYPMHIIPLIYDTPTHHDMLTPVGHAANQLRSVFGALFYDQVRMNELLQILRCGHIQPIAFYDAQFVQNAALRQKSKQTVMLIDLGAEFTTASIWTTRGIVWHGQFDIGGRDIDREISTQKNINLSDAERIKRAVADVTPMEMDRFTPADTAYDFSRSDINDIVIPHFNNIIARISESGGAAIQQYNPTQVILTGGGGNTAHIADLFGSAFGLPCIAMQSDASVRALSTYIWSCEDAHRIAYMARHERIYRIFGKIFKIFHRNKKTNTRFIPIMPSTLSFDMQRAETYSLFAAGGITMIHVDIMDGFYVDQIAGGIDELKFIRAHTQSHLHVHLMTESPSVWADSAIAAGADTVIVSTNTSGVRDALRHIRAAGKRAGIALNPESSVTLLKPILRDIDEVMVMTVTPGAAGQSFIDSCVKKISVLAATRKKYKLKFLISVDGGINAETAKLCWDAGADLLVSGSYLSRAPDFPLAVRSLLKQQN